MTSARTYGGIDVAKAKWDVAPEPPGLLGPAPTPDAGRPALGPQLQVLAPERIVLEAPGGAALPGVRAVEEAALPVRVVKPRQGRELAKATGQLAKTDPLDAQVVAVVAARVQPPSRPQPDAATTELAARLARRRQVSEMLTAERPRVSKAAPALRPGLQAHIVWWPQQVTTLDDARTTRIRPRPVWQKQTAVWQRVPGGGPGLSRTLGAEWAEGGPLPRRPIAAVGAVAPLKRDSGTCRGPRTCWDDRAPVRTAVYLATLVATRCNPVIRYTDQTLWARGKNHTGALGACMRKLVTILNAMLKHRTSWQKPMHVTP